MNILPRVQVSFESDLQIIYNLLLNVLMRSLICDANS